MSESEKPAVKTTIVGGRPPGSGKEVDSVPRGIEILVKKASVDPAFKEALLKERAAAAKRIDLPLEDTEITMLNAIPQPHLEGIISATKVSPHVRQAFLGCTAAVMLAALTTAVDASAEAHSKGIRPDFSETQAGWAGMRVETVDSKKKWEEDSQKVKTRAQQETGTLVVEVKDRADNRPIHLIKINFRKVDLLEMGPAEGTGYTNALGFYRHDGVPIGKYLIEVPENSKYFSETKFIAIIAAQENVIAFHLDNKDTVSTLGIRPRD